MILRSLRSSLTSTLRAGFAAAVLAALTGCATYNRIADYPGPTQPVSVTVAPKPMSKMSELPIGAFYDEQRQIIVTGHQKGLFTGMMFGVVGVIVADQMNKSSGAARYGDDAAKSAADLLALTREAVDQAITAGAAPGWSATVAEAGLRLSPYAVFTVEKSGEARLYAMLRAEIPGTDGQPVWTARYFARAPGLHKLDGTDTWMSGDRFASAMRAALARAVGVCIADTRGNFSAVKPMKAKGRFAYLNIELEWPFLVVDEQPDYVVGRLAAGDVMVMAGTHILDRADYTLSPGDFKDPRH